jgi:hypothetical protein
MAKLLRSSKPVFGGSIGGLGRIMHVTDQIITAIPAGSRFEHLVEGLGRET